MIVTWPRYMLNGGRGKTTQINNHSVCLQAEAGETGSFLSGNYNCVSIPSGVASLVTNFLLLLLAGEI